MDSRHRPEALALPRQARRLYAVAAEHNPGFWHTHYASLDGKLVWLYLGLGQTTEAIRLMLDRDDEDPPAAPPPQASPSGGI